MRQYNPYPRQMPLVSSFTDTPLSPDNPNYCDYSKIPHTVDLREDVNGNLQYVRVDKDYSIDEEPDRWFVTDEVYQSLGIPNIKLVLEKLPPPKDGETQHTPYGETVVSVKYVQRLYSTISQYETSLSPNRPQLHQFDKVFSIIHKYHNQYLQFVDEKAPGFIYLLRAGKTNQYKIGKTKDLKDRISGAQVTNHTKLSLVHCFYSSNIHEQEKQVLEYFDDVRLKGEWFKMNEKDISEFKSFSDNQKTPIRDSQFDNFPVWDLMYAAEFVYYSK